MKRSIAKPDAIVIKYSGGFRGGPSRLRPHLFGQRSDAMTVLLVGVKTVVYYGDAIAS